MIVVVGLGLGWWLYGNKSPAAEEPDALGEGGACRCGPRCATVFTLMSSTARRSSRSITGGRAWPIGSIGVCGAGLWRALRRCFRLWAQFNRFLDSERGSMAALTRAAKNWLNGGGLAVARAERARADLSAHSGRGRGGAGRDPDLEQPGMNEIPVLTLLTLLPARRRGHCAVQAEACARRGAGDGAGVPGALAGDLDCICLPTDRSAWWSASPWAPSLGIEYHLGVDGLGALMLVLSAIVTLMSVDAAQPRASSAGPLFRAGAAA